MGGDHVERERLGQEAGRGVLEGPGHGAAQVVDHDVEPAERLDRGGRQAGHRVEVAQVGGHHVGPSPGGLDLGRHLQELRLGASGQEHVGAGLGQGDRGGGADAAPCAGHDGDLVGHEELVEDHGGTPGLAI
nr:hypothetical protein [Aquihabitans sp. G128]